MDLSMNMDAWNGNWDKKLIEMVLNIFSVLLNVPFSQKFFEFTL
jgi:hypothetical protein